MRKIFLLIVSTFFIGNVFAYNCNFVHWTQPTKRIYNYDGDERLIESAPILSFSISVFKPRITLIEYKIFHNSTNGNNELYIYGEGDPLLAYARGDDPNSISSLEAMAYHINCYGFAPLLVGN